MSTEPVSAANALLACSEVEQHIWLSAPDAPISLDLIAELKRRSDTLLLTDPIQARTISSCALVVAEYLPNEPLALPLAYWASGNWQAYHDPNAAIQSYQLAMQAYRTARDELSVARLLGNLVFAYSDCGRFPEAEQAYQEASSLYQALGEHASLFLLRLEQNYGWLLHNQGQYKQALVSYERALALARHTHQPIIELEVLVNSAITLGSTGCLHDSEAIFLQAQSLASLHKQEVTSARIELDLGWLKTARGQPAAALGHFQTAHHQFARLGNHMELGTVLVWEAMLLERIGALREACLSYAQAAKQFESLDMLPMLGNALADQAVAYRRYGLFPQALSLLNKAQALWEKLDQPLWLARIDCERAALALAQHAPENALMFLQNIADFIDNRALMTSHDLLLADAHTMRWQRNADQHSFREAQHAYERVQHSAEANGDHWAQRQALWGLGRLSLATAADTARSYLEAAATLDDLQRQALSVEELKASFQNQAADILPVLAEIAVDQGQLLAALAYAWRSKGSALLDLLYAAEHQRGSSGDTILIQEIRQQIAALRWHQLHQGADQLPDALRERANPEIMRLEQQLVSLRRRSNQLLQSGSTITERDVSKLIEHMSADWLIEYLHCDERILVLCVNRAGDCHTIWIEPLADILDILDELHLSFHNVLVQSTEQRLHFREAWIAECRPLLKHLYEMLLAPLEQWLASKNDKLRLLIAPCYPLYQLPFAALWNGTHYLIEQYEISLIPSGALLAASAPTPTNGTPLVIAVSAEGRLAHVVHEAATVMAALPASIGLIDDPQALHYLHSLDIAPRILHIATHSVLREDAPIFSALQLTGSMLSVEQCYTLPLRGTQLVTLSSCITGSGLDSGGSLLAFQSALFVAGAKHVLTSLWQIDDRTTTILMELFYHYLVAGHSPAAALHHVQCDLLAQPDMDHPVFWAAFVCSQRF